MGTPKATQAEVAARRVKAVKMRTAGHTWEDIRIALGYSDRAAAHKDVTRALEAARKELRESVEQFRELELQRLDVLTEKVNQVLARQHVVVSASGRIVKNEATGAELVDDGPTLAAVDRLVKISESRRKLLGLDQPAKLEMSGQVLYAVEGVNTDKLT